VRALLYDSLLRVDASSFGYARDGGSEDHYLLLILTTLVER
jgi:hypothetical protein